MRMSFFEKWFNKCITNHQMLRYLWALLPNSALNTIIPVKVSCCLQRQCLLTRLQHKHSDLLSLFLLSKETQQLTAAEAGSKLVKSQTSWRALMMKSPCGGRWTLLTCFQMAACQSYLWSCCWLHREGDLIPDNCWGSWRGGLEIQFLLKQLVRQSDSQSLLSSDSSVSV